MVPLCPEKATNTRLERELVFSGLLFSAPRPQELREVSVMVLTVPEPRASLDHDEPAIFAAMRLIRYSRQSHFFFADIWKGLTGTEWAKPYKTVSVRSAESTRLDGRGTYWFIIRRIA